MSLFRIFTNTVGKLPLIGPHGDFEADLLLHGSKPIGLFVDILPPTGVIEDHSPHLERIRADITRLDDAVRIGQLSTKAHQTVGKSETVQSWHFYCQIGLEDDMTQLANQFMLDQHDPDAPVSLPKRYGEYFGYRRGDINLFENGGYAALPPLIRGAMEATHNFRIKCRVGDELAISPLKLDQL